MDRDTMVARIQEKLGFRTTLVSVIQNALNDQQLELENAATLPWFLLQEDQTFTIRPASPPTSTPQEYALPTGFISESDPQDGNLRWQQTTPGSQIFLTKMDYTEAETFFFSERKSWWDGMEVIIESEDPVPSPGAPKAYVLRKSTIRIYPGPDITYNLKWSYYTHDAPLNGANITNQWSANFPWLLIGRAGMSVAMSTRDKDAMGAFDLILNGKPGFTGAQTAYLAALYDREIGGRRYHMGGRL